MSLLEVTVIPAETALTDQSISSHDEYVIYQISGAQSTGEVMKSQKIEDAKVMTLYSTKNVAAARTEDMYLGGFMCE